MSTDPKGDLIKKSGPLGVDSAVTSETAHRASEPQAILMWQNDETLKEVYELKGIMTEGFRREDMRMQSSEDRLTILEDFNDRITFLPRALWSIAGLLGFNGILYFLHILGLSN